MDENPELGGGAPMTTGLGGNAEHCRICGSAMTVEESLHQNCGGDCLMCMAEAGDSDCMEIAYRLQKAELTKLRSIMGRDPIEFDEYSKPGAPSSYAHLFTSDAQVDMDALLHEKFASGQGCIELQPNMPDSVLLLVMRFAIEASKGKPFLVVPPAFG